MHEARFPLSSRRPEALAAGLDEAKVALLDRWWRSSTFTETECACLRFAEQFVLDAKGMSDEQARPVIDALGEKGTIALVEALAIFDGFGRFCRMLEIEPEGTHG
jgi:alkylhydroperoxidase family enzyme